MSAASASRLSNACARCDTLVRFALKELKYKMWIWFCSQGAEVERHERERFFSALFFDCLYVDVASESMCYRLSKATSGRPLHDTTFFLVQRSDMGDAEVAFYDVVPVEVPTVDLNNGDCDDCAMEHASIMRESDFLATHPFALDLLTPTGTQ
jgi:hypothetical protein